ncbi:hypothetical protein J3R30DRAFT_3309959 [Lentinula aciculospora]|uniref:Uncharacterized protein n=1 Tax=Lentinula aciculospora TaxID=153920 RepID=A0A9W8ZVT2_9AGAR|nr:hypothetical protein J3R30DRAFT_3309959 [Lentinula aciculospora]
MDICNGAGAAGGQVVRWLPVGSEDAAHSGKAYYTNFKQIIWHKSIRKIFESIVQHSKTDYTIKCGDIISQTVFLLVLISSAYFKEQ